MSIEITVERSGLELNVVAEKLSDEVRQKLVEVLALKTRQIMFGRAPWLTGRLASSVRADIGRFQAKIGPQVPYAVYVVSGTLPHEIRPINARVLKFEVFVLRKRKS